MNTNPKMAFQISSNFFKEKMAFQISSNFFKEIPHILSFSDIFMKRAKRDVKKNKSKTTSLKM